MKLDGRVVPQFIDQALKGQPLTVYGDGSQTRSFCFVRDLVDGLCRLMLSEERYPVNLGNPAEMTILEFAERIRALSGAKLPGAKLPIEFRPLPQDDPKRRRPDISKAMRILGWEPRVGLDEGLRETLDSFTDNGYYVASRFPPKQAQ
jgi:dTDP-glucose 4,6-dehydratase